jgi:XTP/dITP diphosphohydrolase
VRKLLIATRNPGKIREYQTLLADLPLTVTSLQAEQIDDDVEETGQTFTENACLKAKTYAHLSGLWTWADDSGLEVDALDGRPGVYSARYAGPNATDRDRYQKLLGELSQIPDQSRTARFRCVVAIAMPNGEIHTIDDTIEGVITAQPKGEHGFGYDPIFFIPELGMTMAELPTEVKNQISHRGKAAVRAKELLYTQIKQMTSS